MQSYQICERIGSGGFSTVFKCYNTTSTFNNKVFAMKKIKVTTLDSLNFALKEAQCCLQLNHTNIVKLYEFFIDKYVDHHQLQQQQQQQTKKPLNFDVYTQEFPSNETWFVCLTLEYCAQGTLKDVITKNNVKKSISLLSVQKIMKWMFQILSALSHIHESRLIHRDLKPENVFLQDGNIKIGMFERIITLCH
jgi:serine/threonine protein kinase